MRTKRLALRPFLVLSLVCFATPASAGKPPSASATPAVAGRGAQPLPELAPRLLATMSLEEKLSQMIMSYPPLDPEAPVTVGAVIVLGPLLKSPAKMKDKIANLQSRARIPLLVSADMEGGKLNRLRSIPALRSVPSGQELGQLSADEAKAWGRKVGRGMRSVGFNCNLGPVLDLAESGIMFEAGRSMGGDPEAVARIGRAYAQGMRAEGVLAIGKHFPGYGPLEKNSDHHLVLTDRSLEEVALHASAFVKAGDSLAGIMLANVAYSAYDSVPAILSPRLVALAHEAGWITVTDDLAIPALSEVTGGDQEEVVRRAFLAGNDLLLTTAPVDWDKGLDYRRILLDLVRSRPELMARVDESVLRLLRIKEKAGLLEPLRKSLEQAPQLVTTGAEAAAP